MDENRITYFAETDSRGKRVPFGIKSIDRGKHIYIIGKTGMGKSTVLENMAVQDIQNGEGFAFIDPHGKTAELLLEYVPKDRIKDVIYFAPFDTDFPISFNVMEDVGPDKRHLVSNGLMSAFKKIWVDAWSARMEYILNNILLALLEYPGSTLIGVNRMLADKDYRKQVVNNISDPSVKAFWIDEFAKYGDRYMQEAGAAIQNKIGQFIANPLVRNIIGQPKSTFDIRNLMDTRKIMIINLSKGRVGETNANLLGSMLITKIYLAAMSRADSNEAALRKLPQFYLYVDEFQSFANESFADILSEARKYKLNLTIAHQYIEQMSEEVRAAVFGNVGSMITFRVGAYDAEVLEKEFMPTFTAEDLVNLGRFQAYLKLMIDGVTSPPFSAATLPPIKKPESSLQNEIITSSRASFARTRVVVEQEIKDWHAPIEMEMRPRDNREPRSDDRGDRGGDRMDRPPRREETGRPRSDSRGERAPERRSETGPSKPPEIPRPEPKKVEALPNHSVPLEPPIVITDMREKPPAIEKKSQSERPISLDTLKKEVKKDRGPSVKNMSQLKDALKDIVEKAKQEEKTKPESPKPHHENKTHSPEIKKEEKRISREVPEDVLKKILEVPKE